jgi:hypothetical protein
METHAFGDFGSKNLTPISLTRQITHTHIKHMQTFGYKYPHLTSTLTLCIFEVPSIFRERKREGEEPN